MASAVVDVLLVKRFSEREGVGLEELPSLIRNLARKVRDDWDSLDREERKALLDIYFSLMNQEVLPWWKKFWLRLMGLFYLSRLEKYGHEYMFELYSAILELKYALTDLIESSNKKYKKLVDEVLDFSPEEVKPMTPEKLDSIFED